MNRTARIVPFLILVAFASCDSVPIPRNDGAAGPRVRATVVTIRTTVQPGNRRHEHAIVIGRDGKARYLGEIDLWRLYDTRNGAVTFVDNIGKTRRRESLQSIVRERQAVTAGPPPAHFTRPVLRATGQRRSLAGVAAEQILIESGQFRRELWISRHPSIPPGLFAMMHASEPPSTPLAATTRAVDDALLKVAGFPLADHIRVPLGKETLTVDRVVIRIETREVAPGLLEAPRAFLDLTKRER